MRSNLAEKTNLEPDRPCAETLYDRLGGRECLARVHKRLYDKIFSHPVLGVFFANVEQRRQEDQQSDFMAKEFGGPSLYRGRLPEGAHQHMFITDALFELRHDILAETLDEYGIEPVLRDRWLAADRRFKHRIVKKTIGECAKRYPTDSSIAAPGP